MTSAIQRHTFLLPGKPNENFVPTVILVYVDEDGEVRTKSVGGGCPAIYTNATLEEQRIRDFGGTIIARIEGEHDLGTGDASAWVAH
jgi:hypothetical protein